MNERVTKLLQPVSAKQPCGPDLSNDSSLENLQTILRGTPEVEIGSMSKPAEPPDWVELQEKSAAFLIQSKDLRAAAMWCCSVLRTEGVPGLRDGLQLMEGLLKQFWSSIYPLLDPDDNNDPTQRLNILAAFTAPRASVPGWLRIVDYLYEAPICRRRGAPPVTFEPLLAADQIKPGEGSPESVPDAAKAAAAIRESGSKEAAALSKDLQEALDAVAGIDEFLTKTLGPENTISFEVLRDTLQAMKRGLAPFIGAVVVSAAAAPGEMVAADATPSGAIAIRGPVCSRADVIRQLDSICAYYDQVEPSSPVPYLLRRARLLVNMNFLQAVQELNVAPIESLRPSMGSALGVLASTQPSAPAPPAASA